MTRFVRLTGRNGGDIYLNVDKIISIWRDKSHTGNDLLTCIITVAEAVDDHGEYTVQESPEDVIRLIRNAVSENMEKIVIQIENPVTDANIDAALRKFKEAQAKLLGT